MSRKIELAEGVWCPNCEVFEVEDFGEKMCLACGCSNAAHIEVAVVSRVEI